MTEKYIFHSLSAHIKYLKSDIKIVTYHMSICDVILRTIISFSAIETISKNKSVREKTITIRCKH